MRFQRRIVSALAALSLLVPALAGCSFMRDDVAGINVDGLSESQQQFLVESVAQLRLIGGIGEVSVAPISGAAWDSPAMIEVEVSEVSAENQARAVVETLRRVSGKYPSFEVPAAFTIRVSGETAGRFRVAGLGLYPDFVMGNFDYWRALEKALDTELTMVVFADDYDQVSHSRYIAPGYGAAARETITHVMANYETLSTLSLSQRTGGLDLAAVRDSSHEYWALPGLFAAGQLPPREVFELVDALSRSFPLQENAWLGLDYYFDYPAALAAAGALVRWTDNEAALHGREVEVNSAEYRDDEWPAILAAAADTAHVTGLDFGYASPEREFGFHTSPCEGTIEQTPDDELLFAALREGGAVSLERLAPGRCVPEYPQSPGGGSASRKGS